MHRLTLVSLIALFAFGCGGDMCTVDGDCAADRYCSIGTCVAACTSDLDCAALGAGASCDTSRGRCSNTAADGGGMDGGAMCASASDCDDGLFCNGSESCTPGDPAADGRGCVGSVAPCAAGQVCSEDDDTCNAEDCANPDADGDGAARIGCGGSDCDDEDGSRYPGNVEVCDEGNVDEDCDPATVSGDSDGDIDEDGFISAACCNALGTGELSCGSDCDDGRANVRPGVAEVCDAAALDENCSGEANEDCTCSEGDSRDCSEAGAAGACGLVRQACVGGTWPDSCPTTTGDEACEGSVDEDCDGDVDEDFDCCEGDARDCDDLCSTDAMEVCTADNEWGTCGATEVCNYCDDDGDGVDDDVALATATTTRDVIAAGTAFGSATSARLFAFAAPATGAFALDETTRVQLGYGSVTLTTTAQPECAASLAGGWSSWVLRANVGDNSDVSPLVSAGFNGEPTQREGYIVSRLWPSARSFSNVRIGSGSTMLGFGGDGYSGTGVCPFGAEFGDAYPRDGHRVVITPDDPATVEDELSVCGYIVDAGGVADEIACCAGVGTGAGQCPTSLSVGDFVVAGISASKPSGTFRFDVTASYTQAGTCAP